jgi:hypothetical protein
VRLPFGDLLSGCVWALILTLAGRASAQSGPLSVSRAPGADDCPEAPELLARIERIRGAQLQAGQPAYRVTFARDAAGIHAEITSVRSAGARVLDDGAPDCTALAEATAVSLALLFDADERARQDAAVAEARAAPVQAPVADAPRDAAGPSAGGADDVELAPPEDADRGTALRAGAALGGGLLVGVTAPSALALALELGLEGEVLGLRLGAHYALPQTIDLAAGDVRESLIAGTLAGCFAAWSASPWRLDGCTGAWLGALHGSAHGFAQDRSRTRLWSAAVLEVRLARAPDPLGAAVVLSLLIPLRRQDFAIAGAGVAYASLPVAALLGVRVVLGGAL